MKYEIRLSKTKRFYFVLKAKNGEIVVTSELYSSKQMCLKGISAVKRSFFARIEEAV